MRLLVVAVIGIVLVCAGCGRQSRAPKPLTLQEFAVEMEKAFRDASPPAKELCRELTTAVAARRYAEAQQAVEMLLALDDLKEEQRLVANRAMLTVMSELQAAQAQGNAEAAAAVQRYRGER